MSKRNARKVGKRAYLKRWSSSVVNAGKTANKLVLGEHAARARTLATPPHKAVYDDNEEHYNKSRVFKIESADAILNNLRRLWTTPFWQGFDKFNRVVLVNTKTRILVMLFSGEHFMFVQQNRETRNHREVRWNIVPSLVYLGREIAMRKYRSAQIHWDWARAKESDTSILFKPAPKLDLENFVR